MDQPTSTAVRSKRWRGTTPPKRLAYSEVPTPTLACPLCTHHTQFELAEGFSSSEMLDNGLLYVLPRNPNLQTQTTFTMMIQYYTFKAAANAPPCRTAPPSLSPPLTGRAATAIHPCWHPPDGVEENSRCGARGQRLRPGVVRRELHRHPASSCPRRTRTCCTSCRSRCGHRQSRSN